MSQKEKKPFDFSIGADPEFILTMQNQKVDAKQTLQLMLSEQKDFKPVLEGYEIKGKGNIGWDGASSTAEIRPAAAQSPKEIVNNMATLFKKLTTHIKICGFSTISEFSSVGGHIHLEVPKGKTWSSTQKNTIQRKLSSFYLPILLSENKINLNLRLRQNYGALNDYRIESIFNYEDGTPGYTLEFRTPSAEWLTTPKIATATLAYVAVIYHEILKHPRKFKKYNDLIFMSGKQADALQALAITEFEILTKAILNKARKYIKTFEKYPKFKKEIEYILNPQKVIKDKQKAEYNIIKGWNLLEKNPFPKKIDILSPKKKIQKIAEKTDFDFLKKVMNIQYNEDTKVALFAEELKDRIAAFNWELKNNYYIFGIRKGTPELIAKNLKDEYLTGTKSIKTISDKIQVNELFKRMESKFIGHLGGNSKTIDFITQKPKDIKESTIIIGIPYEMRIKEDIKSFLSLIWSIEKGTIEKKKKLNSTNLIDDTHKPTNEKGKLFKILTNTPREQEIIIDNNSSSLRNGQNAIQDEINSLEGNNRTEIHQNNEYYISLENN